MTSDRPPRGFLWFVLFLVPILPLPSFLFLLFGDASRPPSVVPPVDLDVSKWAIGGALVSLLAVFLLLRAAARREIPPLCVPRAGAWLFALAAWQALSAIWASNGDVALETATRTGWLFALYVVVVNLCDESAAPRRAATALVAAAGVITLYGLLQRAGLDFPGIEGGPRRSPVSTLGNTNFASEWIVATLPIVVALAFGSATRLGRVGFGIIALAQVAHEFATRTRAGPFSLAVASALAVAWWLWKARGRRAASLTIVALLVAGAIGYVATQWSSPSGVVRREINLASARLALDHPAVGVGAGNFTFAFPRYRSAEEMRLSGLNRVVTDAHNEYLQAAAELGLPGLALLLLFVIAAIRDAIRAFQKTHAPANLAFTGGLAIAIVAVLVNAAFRSPFHNPAASIAFIVAAASAGRLGPRRPFEIRQARRTTIVVPAIVLGVLALFSIRPLVADRWYRTALASQLAAERADDDVRQAIALGLADAARDAQARERQALDEGARSLAQACEIERGNVEYRTRLAKYLAWNRLGRVAEQRTRLREALALHPNCVEALIDLGVSFAHEGKWADAEAAFKKAEAIGPQRWDVLLNLGLVYANQEQWQQAKDTLGRARALDPENTQIRDAEKKLEGH